MLAFIYKYDKQKTTDWTKWC